MLALIRSTATENNCQDSVGMLQGSTEGQGQFTGLILAGSLALGICKAFRFRVAPSGQAIAAYPPEDASRKKVQRGLRTNWGLIEVQAATQSSIGTPGDIVCLRLSMKMLWLCPHLTPRPEILH